MATKQLTTADVAAVVGCHPATVARTAKANQIGRRIGRDWIFSASDSKRLSSLIHESVGNPNFGKQSGRKRG
jgi:hypothetical protein